MIENFSSGPPATTRKIGAEFINNLTLRIQTYMLLTLETNDVYLTLQNYINVTLGKVNKEAVGKKVEEEIK